jgi:protein subunit release factor B
MSKELIMSIGKKDLTVQTFRSGGKGGQNQNKLETGVRIVHKASGAVGESRTERSQYLNKKLALKRLSNSIKFREWVNLRIKEIDTGKTIEQQVEEDLQNDKIVIEVKDENNHWVKEESNG